MGTFRGLPGLRLLGITCQGVEGREAGHCGCPWPLHLAQSCLPKCLELLRFRDCARLRSPPLSVSWAPLVVFWAWCPATCGVRLQDNGLQGPIHPAGAPSSSPSPHQGAQTLEVGDLQLNWPSQVEPCVRLAPCGVPPLPRAQRMAEYRHAAASHRSCQHSHNSCLVK